MGCGKSKHDVASGNTVSRRKSFADSIRGGGKETASEATNAAPSVQKKEENIDSGTEINGVAENLEQKKEAAEEDVNGVAMMRSEVKKEENVEKVGEKKCDEGAEYEAEKEVVEVIATKEESETAEKIADAKTVEETKEETKNGERVNAKEESSIPEENSTAAAMAAVEEVSPSTSEASNNTTSSEAQAPPSAAEEKVDEPVASPEEGSKPT